MPPRRHTSSPPSASEPRPTSDRAARRPTPDLAEARIHARGEEQLDRVLDFVSFVAKPMPLSFMLDEVPKRVAAIVGGDVVSLYLLEGDGDELVMRGNIGFPVAARGTIRLSIGEGITGMAVECMRPVSVVGAPTHARYRRFPELGEDRFPVFLAVPILGHARALGAIVVQRAGSTAFTSADVRLLVALTTPIAAALRHAELLDDIREKTHRRTGGGTRKVTLPGVPVVPGRALGAIAALRRPAARSAPSHRPDEVSLLKSAFDDTEKAIQALVTRGQHLGADVSFLTSYSLMLSDRRLRERAVELTREGGVAKALGAVAREVVRAANGVVGDPFLQDRARDIEDLCDAIQMLASPDARAALPAKAVLVGDQLTVFDLLVSSRAQPVGVALSDRATSPRTRVLLQLLGVPAIIDVANLFRWASPGDVALLNADHGFFVVNPTRAEVALLRAERRRAKEDAALEGVDLE
jgi:phosphotransferase system enzyme I (PtsP)